MYKEQKLDLVGIRGDELPIPIDFGIDTGMASTACWRGYIMRYKIIENRLILDGFWFNSKNIEVPEINGVSAIDLSKETTKKDWMDRQFEFKYKNLDMTIQFDGSLWLAKDFIDSEYVHMGFQSPTAYKTVLKFDFKEGIIVNVEDKSNAVEIARKKGDCKDDRPRSMNPRDLNEWIMKRFSLDIEFYKKKKNKN